MSDTTTPRSFLKRLSLVLFSLIGIVLICVFASRLAVQQIFGGIASSRATGLSALAWDPLYQSSSYLSKSENSSISRSAELQSRTTSFDSSAARLYQIVAAHHGEFEDLRTENRSGQGRTLAAAFSVPATDLDPALNELKALGRVQRISEASEDSTVKAARMDRRVGAAKNNLARLQTLQREHKAGIQDALALQKEIAKATEEAAQVENEQQNLLSTVARAAVHFVLIEEYRAGLNADVAGSMFQLRNSLFDGLSAILSSMAIFLGALLEYGLPIGFWVLLLNYPSRFAWRRIQRFRGRNQVAIPT